VGLEGGAGDVTDVDDGGLGVGRAGIGERGEAEEGEREKEEEEEEGEGGGGEEGKTVEELLRGTGGGFLWLVGM